MARWWAPVLVLLAIVTTPAFTNLAKDVCSIQDRSVDVEMNGANIQLMGLFPISSPSEAAGCHNIGLNNEAYGVLLYQAAKYALKRVNIQRRGSFKMGMRVYDSCSSSVVTTTAIQDFYPQTTSSLGYCTNSTSSVIKPGVIGGYHTSVSQAAAEVLSQLEVPQITYGPSPPNGHTYMLRLTSEDDSLVHALVSVLKYLDWPYYGIIYSPDAYSQEFYNKFLQESAKSGLCAAETFTITPTTQPYDIIDQINQFVATGITGIIYMGSYSNTGDFFTSVFSQRNNVAGHLQWVFPRLRRDTLITRNLIGSVFLEQRNPTIPEFRQYFTSLNPQAEGRWFTDWYMSYFSCQLPGFVKPDPTISSTCRFNSQTNLEQLNIDNDAVQSVIDAVNQYASVIANTASFNTMTSHDMLQQLRSFNLKFNGKGSLVEYRGYNVVNLQVDPVTNYIRYITVGNYTSGGLAMEPITMYNPRRDTPLASIPPSTCSLTQCRYCKPPDLPTVHHLTPGNFLIGGLFSAHSNINGACGNIDVEKSLISLAFNFAIEKYKSSIRGLNIGSLFVDICDNPTKAMKFITDFDGKSNKLPINPKDIIGYTDNMDSDQIQPISSLLTDFEIPLLSSTSSATILGDDALYNSVKPSNYKHAWAIATFLDHNQWKFIQVVTDDDKQSIDIKGEFDKATSMFSICIASTIQSNDGSDLSEVLQELRLKPAAKIVVVIGSPATYRKLLQAITTNNAVGEFILIAADHPGEVQNYVKGAESSAHGHFIIKLSTDYDLTQFNQYLQNLDIEQSKIPFIRELYQETFQCYLGNDVRGRYDKQCFNQKLSAKSMYADDIGYVQQSVYAMVSALWDLTSEVCGRPEMCAQMNDLDDLGEKIHEKISRQHLVGSYKVYNYHSTAQHPFVLVAAYDLKDNKFGQSLQNGIIVLPSRQSIKPVECTNYCSECLYLHNHQPYLYDPGQIIIGSSIGFHGNAPGNPYKCSQQKPDAYQHIAAVKFAIDEINKSPALNGVKLGNLIVDDCESPEKSVSQVSSIYKGVFRPRLDDFHSNQLRGWLSFSAAATEKTSRFLGIINTPVITPSTDTVYFRDHKTYQTLFSAVPHADKLASVIGKLLKNLGNFHYVNILYSNNKHTRSDAETVKYILAEYGICVIKNSPISGNKALDITTLVDSSTHVTIVMSDDDKEVIDLVLAKNLNNRAKRLLFITSRVVNAMKTILPTPTNIVSITLKNTPIQKYHNFLSKNPENDRFYDLHYQSVYQCDLPGFNKHNKPCNENLTLTVSPSYEQHANVLPTINAVFALSSAINMTLTQKCGASYTKVCSEFQTDSDTNDLVVENLKHVSFTDVTGETFQFTEDRDRIQEYSVMQLTQTGYTQVAEYEDNKLTMLDPNLDALYSSIISGCSASCRECILHALNITYQPGDLYLAGVFDVHHKSISPFTCGQIKTLHGFQLLEAFQFAINRVNRDGLLNGVTLGGIGLDGCESAVRTGFLVSNIHQKLIQLQRSGQIIDPEKIVSYIGTYETARSRYLARILTPLKIPQISYGSTSMELSDVHRYPFFLRTVPADDRQSQVIIDFLKKYRVQYVQILNSPTSYGKLGVKEFMEQAAKNQICIGQTVEFRDNRTVTRESANDAITQLLRKPLANIVIIFADTSYLKPFLSAVKRNSNAKSKFHFLGTVSWGVNDKIIKDTIPEVIGSTTITLQSAAIPEFYQHMYDMKPSTGHPNPWFNEYYEAIQNCYLSNPYRKNQQYPQKCTNVLPNYATNPRFVQDNDAIHVINAVYAAAHGLHSTLKKLCGENYSGICEGYEKSKRGEEMLDGIKRAKFVDMTNDEFAFEGRSGNKGYTLYNIETSTTRKYVYKQIGAYSKSTLMVNTSEVFLSEGSNCAGEGLCSECPGIRNPQTRIHLTPSPYPTELSIVGIFDIHTSESEDEFKCGKMDNLRGMKNLLAFNYAVERYNNITRGSSVTFSSIALDTCSNSVRVNTDLYAMISNNLCHLWKDVELSQRGYFNIDQIAGVITTGEENAIAANQVLSPYRVSLVSPDATSSIFRNTESYPYFLRVLPPDDEQAMAVLDILRDRDWSYISVIYTVNQFGVSNNLALINAGGVGSHKICIGLSIGVAETATMSEINSAVEKVHEKVDSGANIVVLFTSLEHTKEIMEATENLESKDKVIWIGSTQWGMDSDIIEDYFSLTEGSITLQPETRMNPALTDNNFPSEFITDQLLSTEWLESLKSHNVSIEFDSEMLQTIIATWTMAHGIRNAYNKTCNNRDPSMCMEIRKNALRREIFSGINGYEWRDIGNMIKGLNIEKFTYNDKQYGNLGYVIHSVDKKDGISHYAEIGYWSGTLNLDSASLSKITSFCKSGKKCTCEYGSLVAAALRGPDYSTISKSPRNFYHYNSDGVKVYEWPLWAVVMAILTAIGIVVAVVLFVVLLIIYPNKSGTTILAFLLIIGIICMYTVNFAFFIHAGEVICGLRRFFLGVVYAICFAALLVKAADNWRHSNYDSYSDQKYKGITSACCLLLIALFLICVQLFIPVMWLILERPAATNIVPSSVVHDYFWCNPPLWYDRYMILAFIYVLLLLLLVVIFAAMSWNKENNLNESQWILFAGCASMGIIFVWMLVSTMGTPPYRDAAVAIGNWVNATLLLLCFPIRKSVWYLIVLRRQKKDEKHIQDAVIYHNEGYSDDYGSDINVNKVNLQTKDAVIYHNEGYSDDYGSDINVNKVNLSYDHAAFSFSDHPDARILSNGGSEFSGGYAVLSGSAADSYRARNMLHSGSTVDSALLARNAGSAIHSGSGIHSRSGAQGSALHAGAHLTGGTMIGGNLASTRKEVHQQSTREEYKVQDRYQKALASGDGSVRSNEPVPYIETTLENIEFPVIPLIDSPRNDYEVGTEEQVGFMDFSDPEMELQLDLPSPEPHADILESSVPGSPGSYRPGSITPGSYTPGSQSPGSPSVTITQLQPDANTSFRSGDQSYEHSTPHRSHHKRKQKRQAPTVTMTMTSHSPRSSSDPRSRSHSRSPSAGSNSPRYA